MLQLIPGWSHVLGKKFRRRTKRRFPCPDGRYRRASFEELEPRHLLSVNYFSVGESLDAKLDDMQGRLSTALNFFQTGTTSNIPIVGNQLGRAANIVSSFSDELQLGLQDLGVSANPSDLQIQTALSARLSSFLNGAGPGGIHVAHAGSNTTIQMLIQGTVDVGGLDINFETGLPSLPIKVLADGEINLTVGYALDLSFTIDATGIVTLNEGTSVAGASSPGADHPIVDANNSLAIFVSAELSSDFSAKAIFGFVEGEITPIPATRNGLYATALVSNLTGSPTIKLDGSADANLRLAGSFAGTNGDFPGISTDFHLHWGLSSSNPNAGAPTVAFDNTSLTFGTFLSNVLRPALDAVQDAIDPVEPVFDLLGTEVPGISNLSEAAGGGPITVADLAVIGSQVTGYGPLGELAAKVVNVLNTVNSLNLGSNISMPLGGFDLSGSANGDLRSAVVAGDFTNLDVADLTQFVAANLNQAAQGAAQAYHDLVNGLDVSPSIKNELNGLVSLPTANGFKLEFPFLDDPASAIFSMLLGQDSDLFYLEANATVDLEGSRASGLSFASQPINFVGQAHIDTHFRFGYDTYGLRQLIRNLAAGDASHIVSDITDGFYINNDSYFKMAGSIRAEADPAFFGGAIGVTVEGGVYTQNQGQTPIHVYIEDPNGDGKLRFNEFFDTQSGKAAFKTTGVLTAELNISVSFPEIGQDPAHDENLNIAQVKLIEFTTPTPLNLASQPDAMGNITLYLGLFAGQRAGSGGDSGDEKFSIYHKAANPGGGEDIEIYAFGLRQTVQNVRNIIAMDQIGFLTIDVMPDVTSNVNFAGGAGGALLNYRGKGAGTLTAGSLTSTLIGGPGTNVLNGGAGNDTIILGSGANTVQGGGGHNTIIVKAPIAQNGTIIGGSSHDNTLQIFGSLNTVAMSAVPVGNAMDVGIQNSLAQPGVHLITTNVDAILIHARDSATSFTFGDVSVAGVTELTLNMVSPFPTTRMVDIDTRVSSLPSTIAINDYTGQVEDPLRPGTMISAQGAVIVNSTTGLTTHLFGWRNDDSLVVRHHGGSIDVSALAFTSGNFTFDTTNRLAGQADSINITTPSKTGGIDLLMTNSAGDVLITTTPYLDFRIKGTRPVDSLNLYISAATSGANTLWFDASALQGELNVYMLGGASAIDHAILSKAGPQADVSIFGQNTTTDLGVGTGQLQWIRHDAYASNVQLTIDNDEAPLGNILTLNATTFGNWLIPALGTTVQLSFSNLRSSMEIFAGADDRFQLDVTPPSITSLTMHNASMAVQDLVYVATWAVPLALLGNFSLFAGQRIHSNGTVERLKRLLNIHSNVTLDYQGNGPSQMVLDGDLDAPGAQYVVDAVRPVPPGRPHLIVNNQTVGLNVTIYGYQQVDTIYVYMPGATVNSNLRDKVPATIYFDGRNRLAGTNPTSPNNINMLVAAGEVTMTPENTYDSMLKVFNTVYVLGAMPQDALHVTQPTEFKMASTAIGQSQIRFDFSLSGLSGFTVTSPTARYTVHSTVAQLPINPLNPNPLEVTPVPISPITTSVDRAIMYTDLTKSPLEAEKIAIRGNTIPWTFNVGGVVVIIPVEVIVNLQIYQPNPNPIATDNHANFDASQLRGTFGFQVSEPDYAYAELLADGLLRSAAPPATNFGQSYVTISKTNPQLTTTITGTTPVNSAHYNPLVTFAQGGTVSRWAGMQVVVGTGDLATLEGNVTVNQAWLKDVDNRNAALANIIQMTTAGVSWGANDGGRTSLTLSNLQGKFTVTGSPLDRFAIEGTPNSSYRTVLRNFSTAATPSGVYVMGKNVMPLEVSGNFDLAVGRRLNLDGTVANVGSILGAMDDTKTYTQTGGTFSVDAGVGLWQDFQVIPWTTSMAGPLTWQNGAFYLQGNGPRPPLPIYYNYSGPGQGTLIFDASNETVTDRTLGDMIVNQGGSNLHGISSNSNYAGKADLRFYESEVIYGPNTNVSWYGAKLRTSINSLDVMAPTLLNNLLNGTVRYFANPANAGQNPIEQILIGATLGPVYVEGSGRNTRVEINPLFSLPTSLAMGIFDTSINNQSFAIGSHPGWSGGHTGGYSLVDSIQANVSVSTAALRVIGDIPRPVGSPPITSRPNVTIDGTSVTGIGTGTINYSNLVDSVIPGSFTFNSQLDLNALNFPGLNVQLPAHFPVDTTVQNTPAGATTQITTVLSSTNNTFTNGALNVLGTTGKLILGEMYGVAPTNGDKFNWPGLAGTISTSWSDGISASQINIGNNGSQAGIQGAILLKGDSHSTTTTVTNIDGRNDTARSNASFTRITDGTNPFPVPLGPYQRVDGLAPATIYFGSFYQASHLLNIYGSGVSSYNVVSAPVDMTLYQGAGSNSNLRGTPLTVVGGSLVTLLVPNNLTLPNFAGVPEIYVQQDAAAPAPINIVVEKADSTSNGNFRLESTGNGMMRLKDSFVLSPFNVYWGLNYKGSDATLSVNYGTITIADTGSLGTTASSKATQVNVHGTSSLLKILPVGTSTGNALITLGNNGNMQAILGDVQITPNPTAGAGSADNQNDTGHRDIHVSHVANVLTVTGMSPGTIKYFSQFAPSMYGGSGGSTFYLDNMPTYASYLLIRGGSSANDIGVAPDVGATFDIALSNYAFVNSKVVFDGVESLRSGTGNDTFRFIYNSSSGVTGSLSGGIDGGAGTDTLVYDNSSSWHNVPYDLSQGIAPLVAGFTTSIERAPFDLLSPGSRVNTVGEVITPFTVGRYGGPLNVTYSATGLPPGLTLDTNTGLVTGTIPVSASNGSYAVHVTATDGFNSAACDFQWTVVDMSTLEAISLSDPSLGPLPNSDTYLDRARRVVSTDGRYVAYSSGATNLVPGDTNNRDDVFVRDRQTGTTTLVSRGISGPGNRDAYDPSISGDGRYVAFYSNSTNLVPGGTTGYQVFLRDMQTGTTSLISSGPSGQGNGTSYAPTISPDGRYVAFLSIASNLVPGAANGFNQVFVRDLQAGTTALVSTGSNGIGDRQSYDAAISGDGRYVAFTSFSTNLVPGGTNGTQVFVRDLQAGSTTLVSIGVGGQSNQSCNDVSISADGRHVAFDTRATNLVAQATNSVSNVYMSDWQNGTILLVSVGSDGQIGNNGSYDATISASGRYVAFDSSASNFAIGDSNGKGDVFLRDLQTGITKRISVGPAGQGDRDSINPSISADGRSVVFNSYATNLVTNFNVPGIYLYNNPLTVADIVQKPGDFNRDGAVDAADYIVWRKGLGTTFAQSDYNVWRSHYGETASGGAALSVADTSLATLTDIAGAGSGDVQSISAAADALLNDFGYPSYQPGVLGPAPPSTQPEFPDDFNDAGAVDSGDYITWRKLGMNASEYDAWRPNFGQTFRTGGGIVISSSSVSETLVAQATPGATEAVLFQEATLTASSVESDPAPPATKPSNAKSHYFNIDFDFGLLAQASRGGMTSAIGSQTINPIVSDATHRNDLLALYQAIRATEERLVALTAFDVDWFNAADDLSGNDGFDIHAIDDAFDELNLTVN